MPAVIKIDPLLGEKRRTHDAKGPHLACRCQPDLACQGVSRKIKLLLVPDSARFYLTPCERRPNSKTAPGSCSRAKEGCALGTLFSPSETFDWEMPVEINRPPAVLAMVGNAKKNGKQQLQKTGVCGLFYIRKMKNEEIMKKRIQQ